MQNNHEECLTTDLFKNRIQNLVDSFSQKKYVDHVTLSISAGSKRSTTHYLSTSITNNASETEPFTPQSQYFLASTTKLIATVLIMQLRDEGSLKLDDKIVSYFGDGELAGLHVFEGRDRTADITIRHLLSHTSGVADYFGDKPKGGSRFSDSLLLGNDQKFTVTDVVTLVRNKLPAKFPPGTPGKAYYSDTNYQLLGSIIETITRKSLTENVRSRIAEPLGLKNTYLFSKEQKRVLPLRNKSRILDIPLAMESVRLDGGLVSTSAESLVFIQAFMQGRLFPKEYVNEIQQWNSIFFPLKAGIGIIKFQLPWILNPVGRRHSLIGHSGISGAFAFYSPTSDIYLTGTVNQLNNQRLPFNLMLRVVREAETCRNQVSQS